MAEKMNDSERSSPFIKMMILKCEMNLITDKESSLFTALSFAPGTIDPSVSMKEINRVLVKVKTLMNKHFPE
jgi:hypothetical protein|tara:strand:- start:88 stop:303 length:216 start_codon:yes stop_codon:yes gene_type:complete